MTAPTETPEETIARLQGELDASRANHQAFVDRLVHEAGVAKQRWGMCDAVDAILRRVGAVR